MRKNMITQKRKRNKIRIQRMRKIIINSSLLAALLTISGTTLYIKNRDKIPPVIHGVEPIIVYAGNNISYFGGISSTDNKDANPELLVDTSDANLNEEGTYKIIYTARDAAGNTSSISTTLTVVPRNANVDTEIIVHLADEVIEELSLNEMNTYEQVNTIYQWARSELTYFGHSDQTDWRQTAYIMLTERTGDCFGYYAVTKLLFERLDIPNIDVRKVKNHENDSNHFWSLVSVDGGENYYHFDATPRISEGDDFCLVTDTYLDEYSKNNENSHNRDKSLYPSTPEEDLI